MGKQSLENVTNIEKHLRKVDYIIRRKGREILADFDITVPQFTALQMLINRGNMTIGELSQNMDLACSTITDLIDRMEKSKLVMRQRDDRDRRVVRIKVLEKGYDILEEVMKRRIDFLDEKLAVLSSEEKANLDKGLESLYEAMKEE